jgi:hypothetical protein
MARQRRSYERAGRSLENGSRHSPSLAVYKGEAYTGDKEQLNEEDALGESRREGTLPVREVIDDGYAARGSAHERADVMLRAISHSVMGLQRRTRVPEQPEDEEDAD